MSSYTPAPGGIFDTPAARAEEAQYEARRRAASQRLINTATAPLSESQVQVYTRISDNIDWLGGFAVNCFWCQNRDLDRPSDALYTMLMRCEHYVHQQCVVDAIYNWAPDPEHHRCPACFDFEYHSRTGEHYEHHSMSQWAINHRAGIYEPEGTVSTQDEESDSYSEDFPVGPVYAPDALYAPSDSDDSVRSDPLLELELALSSNNFNEERRFSHDSSSTSLAEPWAPNFDMPRSTVPVTVFTLSDPLYDWPCPECGELLFLLDMRSHMNECHR